MKLLNNTKKPSYFIANNDNIIYLLILLFYFVYIIIQFSVYINHDVGSHIILSQRLMNKMEIVDPNPPLIFWLLTIPNLIANVTQISVLTIFRISIFMLIIVSVLQCNHILESFPKSYNNKFIILTLVFIFTLMPRGDFGQREHIIIILVTPYIFTIVRRSFDEEVYNLQSAVIGIFAGIGFCLKPYYLLLPLLLEAYIFYKNRRLSLYKHIESFIIIIIFTIYLISIFIFNRDYITRTVPYVICVYGAYNENIITLFSRLYFIIIVFIIYWLAKDETSFSAFANILLLSAICMAIIYLVQGKGWSYHLYPCKATSFLLIIYCCSIIALKNKFIIVNLIRTILYYVVILFVIISVSKSLNWHFVIYQEYKSREKFIAEYKIIQLIKKQTIGSGNIYFISTSAKPAFPVVNYSGVGWSSRFNALWMLPAIINNKELPHRLANEIKNKKLYEIESYLFESVLADLEAQPPSLIFVDNSQYKQGLGNQKFDFMEYFMKDPVFREFMSQYKELTWVDDHQVFKRILSNN